MLRVTTAKEVINTVYTLDGQILEVVTSARYLGVDISSGLTWNSHIDRITGNANRTLGYIRRNIKTKNQKVRETAYNTLVRPQLEYSAPVWDPSTKDKRLQLENIQKRAARWTTSNYDTRSSVSAMLNQLGWRTLEQRCPSMPLLQNCLWTCSSTSSKLCPTHPQSIGQVGMTSLQVNCSLAEVNASVFIAVF